MKSEDGTGVGVGVGVGVDVPACLKLQSTANLIMEAVSETGVCQHEATNRQSRLGRMSMAIVIGWRWDLANAG